ncbi:MAG: response regulator transcription factor [Myxococcota bacterium]
MTLRLFIVDDHPVVIEGIRRFVATEETLDVVGHATSVPVAVEALSAVAADVVSLDVRVPGMEGASTVSALVTPQRAVLLFTLEAPSPSLAALVEAGASGFASKSDGLEAYVRTVQAVGRGETVLPIELANMPAGRDPRRVLSPRERQLFDLLARGRTIQEAAYDLDCAASTAYSHFARIKEKLHVTSVADCVALGDRWRFDPHRS